MIGSTFGMLKVTSHTRRKNRRTYVSVLCCCGNEVEMRSDHVRKKKHCGCLSADLRIWSKRTHGMSNTPEYYVWAQMWSRCTNEKHESYPNYGGRGIYVCNRWESFENFMKDMGRRPSDCEDIDRKDNNREYSAGNCRWTTKVVNCRNTRKNINLTLNGKTQPVSAWAEEVGLPYAALADRVRRGWSDEDAIRVPLNLVFSRYGKMQNR